MHPPPSRTGKRSGSSSRVHTAEPLTDYLDRMKFMLRVDIENMSGDYAVVETARNPRGEQGAIHPVFADALIWRTLRSYSQYQRESMNFMRFR